MIRELIANQKPRVAAPEMTVRDAVQWMVHENCGSIMVERDGHLIGIFTEHDALTRVLAEGRDSDKTHLHEVMTRNPVSLSPDKPLLDALHAMRQFGFRHVPVIEDGRPVGIVSLRDVLESEFWEFKSGLGEPRDSSAHT